MNNFNEQCLKIINKDDQISFHQNIFSDINFEDENKKFYNNNKYKLDDIIQNLDFNKPVVFIGKGKTLFQPITKENIMKKMNLTITPYIVAINDSWILCEEYDFVITNDEIYIPYFIKWNKSNKPLLCNIYPSRWIFHPVNKNIGTPLFSYTRHTDKQNIIGAFQTYGYDQVYGGKKIKMLDNIIKINPIRGGQMALEFFLILGFKNIYTTGFQGTGYSTHWLENNKYPKPKYIFQPEYQEKIDELAFHPNVNHSTKPMYDEIENKYKIKINYI